MTFTKLASEVFAGYTGGGAPRMIDNAEAVTWGGEVEDKIASTSKASNPIQFGADPTGSAISTSAIMQARDYAIANGIPLEIPAGTYLVSGFSILSGLRMVAVGAVTLKRPASDAATAIVSAVGQSGFEVAGITFDGNAANNTVGADNIYISGCANFVVRETSGRYAKYNFGRGNAIYVADSTDSAASTRSRIIDNDASDCAVGILIQRCNSIVVDGNFGEGNTYGGIKIDDPTLPIVAGPANQSISVRGNEFKTSGVGIGLFGDRSGVTAIGDILSQTSQESAWITVADNRVSNNQYYGLAVQASGVSCTGNNIFNNGSSTSNGGALFNSLDGVFDSNVIIGNYHFGLDAGFAYRCIISNNVISSNGQPASTGVGINVGASNACKITGNKIGGNGSAAGSYQILASGLDGSGLIWAPFTGYDLDISGNDFDLTAADQCAISVRNGFAGVSITNNRFTNRVGASVFDLSVSLSGVKLDGNTVLNAAGNWAATAASASTMVIPDYGNVITVSGTTMVNTLHTAAQNAAAGKVASVNMTDLGAGYTSAPTVAFSGGGGSGAAGIATLAADGKIYGVYMTDLGAGYTSAPTVAFSGGGGSGAAATAYIGVSGPEDRVVTLRFEGVCTIKNATGNIYLAGSDFGSSATKTLVLRSAFGNWYEVSRT